MKLCSARLPAFLSACILLHAPCRAIAQSVEWITPPDQSGFVPGTILGLGRADGFICVRAVATGTVEGAGMDLVLVMDCSGSVSPNPWGGVAREGAAALLRALPGGAMRVGIVAFGGVPKRLAALQDLAGNRISLVARAGTTSTPSR